MILAGISNQALAAGELPNRLKILNWGENPSQRGPVMVDEKTLAAIEAQRKDKAFARILIDFDHQSVPGTPNHTPSPRKHVGYGDLICLAGEGVFLDNLVYTPAGKEFAREYSDISPTVSFFDDGKTVARIPSVALCPNGAVHDLTFFSADPPPHTLEAAMNEEDAKKLVEQIAALNDAMKALAAEVKALKDENAMLRQANDDLAKKLDSSVATFSAEAQKAAAAAEAMERRTLIAEATREGKVLPMSADGLAGITLEALREMVAVAKPGTVPLGARTPAKVIDDAGQKPDGAAEIRRNCGLKT
jgi:regulator of replication initiation timing